MPVHFANGIWGIIAVGLFDVENGLFYSGNAELLGIQLLGVITILAWTAVWMTIFFAAIKYVPVMIKYKTVKPSEIIAYGKTWNGLRCNPEEEIIGLDISEHGLTSSYPDFVPSIPSYDGEGENVDISGVVPATIDLAPANETKYTKVTIVTGQDKFLTLKDAMAKIGVTGMTVTTLWVAARRQARPGSTGALKRPCALSPRFR